MPEMHFRIRWPDGRETRCYSPSLVVREHLEAGARYPLDEFLRRTNTALGIASERVRAKYGYACSRAADELARIDRIAGGFAGMPDAVVEVVRFDPQEQIE